MLWETDQRRGRKNRYRKQMAVNGCDAAWREGT